MKKLFILLAFVSFTAYGQLDTIDLKVSDFGLPSRAGEADFVKNEAYKINQGLRELDNFIDFADTYLFLYFNDSAVSLSYTTAWAFFVNASDSIFIREEVSGFEIVDDTIIFDSGGGYDFFGNFTHDGDDTETVTMRFYNVTQAKAVANSGKQTTSGANYFGSTPVLGHADISASDSIVIQYKGTASGTAVFKNAVVRISKIHE